MNLRYVILGQGASDRFYVGKTTKSQEEILADIKSGTPISLEDCRLLIHAIMPAMTHQGPTISIQMRMVPLPACNSSIKVAGIKATVYIDPEDCLFTSDMFKKMIEESENLEKNMRAREAGIFVPQGRM
jgi:hypothetical protein